jgi:hypothetical protein
MADSPARGGIENSHLKGARVLEWHENPCADHVLNAGDQCATAGFG